MGHRSESRVNLRIRVVLPDEKTRSSFDRYHGVTPIGHRSDRYDRSCQSRSYESVYDNAESAVHILENYKYIRILLYFYILTDGLQR